MERQETDRAAASTAGPVVRKPYARPKLTKRDKLARVTGDAEVITGEKIG